MQARELIPSFTRSSESQMARLTLSKRYGFGLNLKVRMMKLSEKEKENALNEVRILASLK